MSRLLLLDRGNRFLKTAIAESGEIGPGKLIEPGSIEVLIAESGGGGSFDGVVFSSVVPAWSAQLKHLLEAVGLSVVVEVGHNIGLPFTLGVDEPQMLGADRISAAAGAWAQGAREAVIVDAGTAVTVDVLRAGVFEGGAIFPGSGLLARSLSDGTAVLPFVPGEAGEVVIPGRNTEAAIRAGIAWGLVGAVTELVRRSSPPGASVWLTGGECDLYTHVLEGDLHIDRDLVLKGLLEIYTLNSG